jgi:type II secretory pathway pseudopilin PulG
MKSLFRLLLKTQLKRNGSQPDKINSGMTMLELLVGTIMAFLIITPMLTFVVDMLNTDRREQVKANTEQDIQSAASFMAQDLSQAVRIYNQSEINTLRGNSPPPISVPANSTPILVFWKRQLVKDAIPVKNCVPDSNNDCLDDTNVMSFVTYYVRQNNDTTWCPDGTPCPARIERLEIRDGVKDPNDDTKYLCDTTPSLCPKVDDPKKRNSGFNSEFEIEDATKLKGGADTITKDPEVLVNNLDHTPLTPATDECKKALGNPQDADGNPIDESILRVAGNYAGFYACVDSSRTLAQVFIRGNALRRIQKDADYSDKKTAFFPKASFQVQGLSGLGQ